MKIKINNVEVEVKDLKIPTETILYKTIPSRSRQIIKLPSRISYGKLIIYAENQLCENLKKIVSQKFSLEYDNFIYTCMIEQTYDIQNGQVSVTVSDKR